MERGSVSHMSRPFSSTSSNPANLAATDHEQDLNTASNRASAEPKGDRRTEFTGTKLSAKQLEDGMTAHIHNIVDGWFKPNPKEQELDRGEVLQNK